MSIVRVHARGDFPPERFVKALIDFDSTRAETWANSQASHLHVHDQGETWAEVTEGSAAGGGIWQRLRYDWSTPGVVVLDVLDSNAFGRGSRWEYRVSPEPGGGTRVDLTINRVPTTTKGKILDVLLRLGGQSFFARDLRRSIRKLEGDPSV